MVCHTLGAISIQDITPVAVGGKFKYKGFTAPVSDDVVAGNERIIMFQRKQRFFGFCDILGVHHKHPNSITGLFSNNRVGLNMDKSRIGCRFRISSEI